MRLVATLKNREEISKLARLGTDVFLLETDGLTRDRTAPFSPGEIIHLARMVHLRRKKVYVLLNTILHEDDLEKASLFLETLAKAKIDGFVCYDLTYFPLLQALHLENKLIYQPGTYNTNPYDLSIYQSLNIKGITLARELTIAEIRDFFTTKQLLEISFSGHGYQEMFHSGRRLLTAYFAHKGIKMPSDAAKTDFSLREKQRQTEFYPLSEDRFGTQIYRSGKLQSFAYLEEFDLHLADFFLERRLLSDQEYYAAISAYSKKRPELLFKQYPNGYDEGFFQTPTERIKGDF